MKKIFAIMLMICIMISTMTVFAADGESIQEEEIILISAPVEVEAEKEETVEFDFETVEKHAIMISGKKVDIVNTMGTIVEKNGVVFVPVRALLEAVGYQVNWVSNERVVMGVNAMTGAMFIMQLENTALFFTNGKTDGKIVLEAEPFMNNQEFRTYVPLNGAAEVLEYKVSYDAEANMISLSK